MDKRLRRKLKDGRFHNVPELRSRAMGSVRSKGNRSTELAFRMALVRARERGWRMHVSDLAGKPDFYFHEHRLAVFIDGCFWHGCPKHGHIPTTNREYWDTKIRINRQRDRRRRGKLATLGIRTVRLWEHDLTNPDRAVQKVKSTLARYRVNSGCRGTPAGLTSKSSTTTATKC